MCDANSFIAAGSQMMRANIQQQMTKDAGDFEAAQLHNQVFLVAAQGRDEMTDMNRSYREHMEDNLAAAIVSGIAVESFAPIAQGNEEDRRRNIRRIAGNVRAKQLDLQAQADAAKMSARLQAKVMKAEGMMGALTTLAEADANYRETHMAENPDEKFGRVKHFGRSLGLHKTERFGSFFEPKES